MKFNDDFEAKRKSMLFGLGFDGDKDHKYITKGDNFYLSGGSNKTHELMLDNVMRFNWHLKKYGKKMEHISREEYYKIVKQIGGDKLNWGYFDT
ncbi:hypothetical protein J7L67_08580 [bacterium]|nr:hypothetical protein [bacterium]